MSIGERAYSSQYERKMKMSERLTKKEREFCRYYVSVRNAREAAALSGYTAFPQKNGMRLLHKQAVRDEIDFLVKQENGIRDEAAAGFRRLAFGSVADAVRLIEGKGENLDSMDLFMVSDIKMPKGGGMEIKFFDRQKALESLMALQNNSSDNSAMPFYKALEKSASFVSQYEDDGVNEL